MKNNKGITLIALIITIIVMIILVAVTIVTAQNGGLFNNSKEAAFKTEVRQIQESLMLERTNAVANNNGMEPDEYNISLNDLQIEDELKTRYNNKLTIEDGVLLYVEDKVTPQEAQWLIELGVGTYDEPVWEDIGNGQYQKGDTIVEAFQTTYKHSEVKAKFGVTGGTYDDNSTWTVVGIEGGKLKLISTTYVNEGVTLGWEDPRAIAELPNGTTRDRAIWSYLNLVDTLDFAAQDATAISSAKCITLEDMYDIIGNLEDWTTHEAELNNSYYDLTVQYYVKKRNATEYVMANKSKAHGSDTWSSENTMLMYPTSMTCLKENGERNIIDTGDNISKTITLTRTSFWHNYTQTDHDLAGFIIDTYPYCWFANPRISVHSNSLPDYTCAYNNGSSITFGNVYAASGTHDNGGKGDNYSNSVFAVVYANM